MPKGNMIDQALCARCPASGLGHNGFDRCFINKRQSFYMVSHERLTFGDPSIAQISDILALLLKRLKVLFCVSNPIGAANDRSRNGAPLARALHPNLPSVRRSLDLASH